MTHENVPGTPRFIFMRHQKSKHLSSDACSHRDRLRQAAGARIPVTCFVPNGARGQEEKRERGMTTLLYAELDIRRMLATMTSAMFIHPSTEKRDVNDILGQNPVTAMNRRGQFEP